MHQIQPDKVWCWDEPSEDGGNDHFEATEREIINTYYPFWRDVHRRAVETKGEEINKKLERDFPLTKGNCIEDFIIVHWAYEKAKACI